MGELHFITEIEWRGGNSVENLAGDVTKLVRRKKG
jgi:hypothetical protein